MNNYVIKKSFTFKIVKKIVKNVFLENVYIVYKNVNSMLPIVKKLLYKDLLENKINYANIEYEINEIVTRNTENVYEDHALYFKMLDVDYEVSTLEFINRVTSRIDYIEDHQDRSIPIDEVDYANRFQEPIDIEYYPFVEQELDAPYEEEIAYVHKYYSDLKKRSQKKKNIKKMKEISSFRMAKSRSCTFDREKTVWFNDYKQVYEAYAPNEYDRRGTYNVDAQRFRHRIENFSRLYELKNRLRASKSAFEKEDPFMNQANEIPEKKSITQQIKDFIKNSTMNEYIGDVSSLFTVKLPKIIKSEILELSLNEAFKSIGEIKPLNLSGLIAQFFTGETLEMKVATIAQIFELYGLFWDNDRPGKDLLMVSTACLLMYLDQKEYPSALPDFSNQGLISEGETTVSSLLSEMGISLESAGTVLSMLVALTIGVITVFTGTVVKKETTFMDSVWKHAKAVADRIKSCKTIIESVPAVFNFIMEHLASLLGLTWVTSEDSSVKQFREDLLKFKTECYELTDLITNAPAEILKDPERVQRCEDVIKDLDKQYTKMMEQKSSANTKGIFDEIKQKTKIIHKWALDQIFSKTVKQEPVTVMFSGEPGIGKSRLMNTFGNMICKLDPTINNSHYARNVADPFASGYAGQTFWNRDDFGQDKADIDHQELILYKNPNKSNIKMAEIEDKGKPFTSKFMLLSSNRLDSHSSSSVNDTKAINRRRNLLIMCVDPNLEAFRQQYKCRPCDWKNPEDPSDIGNPWRWNNEEKKDFKIYYYHDDYSHLQFFRMNPIPEERTEPGVEMTLEEIAREALYYEKMYRTAYIKGITPVAIEPEMIPDTSYDMAEIPSEATMCPICITQTAFVPMEEKTTNGVLWWHKDCYPEFQPPPSSDSGSSNSKWSETKLTYVQALNKNGIQDEIKHTKKRLNELKKQIGPIQYEVKEVAALPVEQEYDQWLQAAANNFGIDFGLVQQEDLLNPMAPTFEPNEYIPDNTSETASEDLYNNQANEAPFIASGHSRCKVIALSGQPGTGKTTLIEEYINLLSEEERKLVSMYYSHEIVDAKISTPCIILDDISVDEEVFNKARQIVLSTYTGRTSVKLLIVTFNDEVMTQYFKTQQESELFYRRMEVFKFVFDKKPAETWYDTIRKLAFAQPYWQAKDIELGLVSVESATKIIDIDNSREKKKLELVNRTYLREKLQETKLEPIVLTQTLCLYPPHREIEEELIQFQVRIRDETMFQVCYTLYNDPMKMIRWLTSGKAKLEKGSKLQGLNIARTFSTRDRERPAFPSSLDRFIIEVNNFRWVTTEKFNLKFIADDYAILLEVNSDVPGTIRCAYTSKGSVDHKTAKIANCEEAEKNIATRFEYDRLDRARYGIGAPMIRRDPVNLHDNQVIDGDLITAVEDAEEESQLLFGFLSIKKDYPILWNIMLMSVSMLKLGLASMAMERIISHHMSVKMGSINVMYPQTYAARAAQKEAQKAFGCKFDDEAKGKNKKSYDYFKQKHASLYDEIKEHKSALSAKNIRLGRAIRDFCELYDGQEYSQMQLRDFINRYDGDLSVFDESDPPNRPAPTRPRVELLPWEFEAKELTKIYAKMYQRTHCLPDEVDNSYLEPGIPYTQEELTPPLKHVEEGSFDPSIREIFTKVKKNLVEVGYMKQGTFEPSCQALMIEKQYGVTVHHIKPETSDAVLYVRYYITDKGIPKEQIFSVTKVHSKYRKRDILIFELPPQAKMFPSIKHYLPTEKTDLVKTAENKSGVLYVYDRESQTALPHGVVIQTVNTQVTINSLQKEGQIYSKAYTTGLVSNGSLYTKVGDCGSPLFLNSPTSGTVKLLGIHNAANSMSCYTSLLLQEYFADLEAVKHQGKEPEREIINLHEELVLMNKPTHSLCDMPIVGHLTTPIYIPKKTRFWKSPLEINPENQMYEPSIMCPRDTRLKDDAEDPYFKSLAKWSHKPPVNLNLERLDKIAQDVSKIYVSAISKLQLTCRKLTKTEAINGIPDRMIQPIPRDTSSGTPWRQYGKKKSEYLIIHNSTARNSTYWSIDLESKHGRKLNNAVDRLINECRKPNVTPAIVFNAFPKDEPVKKKKIDENNVRTFAGAPYDYTLAHRIYFGYGIGLSQMSRARLPAQIGMNPNDGLDWHTMITTMLSCSDIGFDADFKAWDSTVIMEFNKRVPVVWNSIYKAYDPNWIPEDDIVRTNLHSAIWKPLISCPDPENDDKVLVIQPRGGMVSGQPATAPDNCIIHLMYLLWAWYEIMDEQMPQLSTLTAFMYHVCPKIYGDDGFTAVKADVIDKFNFLSFQHEMEKLHITCTPAAKGDEILAYQRVVDMEFLKRNTVKRDGFYFGALQKNSFQKMLNWSQYKLHHYYRQPDAYGYEIDSILSTINSALREAVLHGRQFYDEMFLHLDSVNREHHWGHIMPSYDDLRKEMDVPFT